MRRDVRSRREQDLENVDGVNGGVAHLDEPAQGGVVLAQVLVPRDLKHTHRVPLDIHFHSRMPDNCCTCFEHPPHPTLPSHISAVGN